MKDIKWKINRNGVLDSNHSRLMLVIVEQSAMTCYILIVDIRVASTSSTRQSIFDHVICMSGTSAYDIAFLKILQSWATFVFLEL